MRKVGYQRKGYSWSKSVKQFKKTGSFKHVQQGQGHAAGEEWGNKKGIDPDSRQRRYSKNSPSFDEGVYKSKQNRKKQEMAHKMVASPQFQEKIKSEHSRLNNSAVHMAHKW